MNSWKKVKYVFGNISTKSLAFIILLWVVITVLTVHALITRQFSEYTFDKNMITQRTAFDYKTEELPDGIVAAEGIIFPKTQKTINVIVETEVSAVEPVSAEGNYSILLTITAEGLWERSVALKENQHFSTRGTNIGLINENVSVDLEKIYSEIELISSEIIGNRPGKFLISIAPVIEGYITYEDSKVKLESDMSMKFELAQNQVALTGEKEYLKQIPIEKTETVENKINIFGAVISVPVYRYITLPVFLLYSVFALLIIISKRRIQIEQMTEADEIEREYKNKLVPILRPLDYKSKVHIPLVSIESLVRVSDEQDRGIFKYQCDEEGKIFYYVIENDYIYTYTVDINKK